MFIKVNKTLCYIYVFVHLVCQILNSCNVSLLLPHSLLLLTSIIVFDFNLESNEWIQRRTRILYLYSYICRIIMRINCCTCDIIAARIMIKIISLNNWLYPIQSFYVNNIIRSSSNYIQKIIRDLSNGFVVFHFQGCMMFISPQSFWVTWRGLC